MKRFLALTCAFLFIPAASAAAAPTADFTFSPTTPAPNQTVTFDPTVTSDGDGSPIVADWDFESDGTVDALAVDPNTDVTHQFPGPGTYQVRLVARELVPGLEQTVVVKPVTVVAPNVAPVAQFTFRPGAPVVGQEVIFESFSYDSDGTIDATEWDLNYDGANFTADLTGATPTTTFATAGSRTIGMRVTDDDGATSVTSRPLTIGPAPSNPLPVAQFSVSPNAPDVGEQVSLRSFSYDPGGSVVSQRWDLDGDLDFDENVTGATAFTTFTTPGAKTVRIEVRGSDGQTQTATQTVNVQALPRSRAARHSLMYPFPVVRLAGSVFPRGARVKTLEVRAPRRSKITVRCNGRSCPAKRLAKRQKRRTVRFKRMSRFLRAGTVVTVSVRKGDRIGKHTRWRIRAGKLPKRTDRCLYPDRRKPTRCPRR